VNPLRSKPATDQADINPPPPYSPPPPPGTTHRNANAQPPPPEAGASRPQLPFLQTSFGGQRGPGGSDYGSPMSAVTLVTPLSTLDPNRPNFRSNMSPMTPRNGVVNFPPPPGRDTSASRTKAETTTTRSRFGLSALRGKSSDRSAPQQQEQASAEPVWPPQPIPNAYSAQQYVNCYCESRLTVAVEFRTGPPSEPLCILHPPSPSSIPRRPVALPRRGHHRRRCSCRT
jgi:hypothetical protein